MRRSEHNPRIRWHARDTRECCSLTPTRNAIQAFLPTSVGRGRRKSRFSMSSRIDDSIAMRWHRTGPLIQADASVHRDKSARHHGRALVDVSGIERCEALIARDEFSGSVLQGRNCARENSAVFACGITEGAGLNVLPALVAAGEPCPKRSGNIVSKI